MKTKFPLLKWLFTRHNRPTFSIPAGGYAVVLNTYADFEKLVEGLSDAEVWTGEKYSEILTKPETLTFYNNKS
jgi:hypothetical protein